MTRESRSDSLISTVSVVKPLQTLLLQQVSIRTLVFVISPKKTYQNSENISTIIAALKVISAVISLSTSRDLLKSAATAVFATERVCP